MTAAANSKLVTRIFSSSDQPTKAIIGLHGWTGDEHVFEPVAKMMNIDGAQVYHIDPAQKARGAGDIQAARAAAKAGASALITAKQTKQQNIQR